jgi:A/G-specific adenine glycosylase
MQDALLGWHSTAARDLPWRHRRDQYAVLVSEVMLQQTQVRRVVPRFRAWMERWPTVEALAAAPLADVIRAWQGLGLNRRAVTLHRAAVIIAAAGWPDDLTELPGVGHYTADALRRFARGEPVLPLDVNVRRVIARSGGQFDAEAAEALMDLGATVCIARVPRCGECPLALGCPSRGERFAPERRQGPFEGSFRQRRSRALRSVASAPRPTAELDPDALEALVTDGLVCVEAGEARLPGAA